MLVAIIISSGEHFPCTCTASLQQAVWRSQACNTQRVTLLSFDCVECLSISICFVVL